MKNSFYILLLLCTCFVIPEVQAQAPSRRKQQTQQEDTNRSSMTVRARTQYNAAVDIPEDPKWKREIYRTIDLTQDANSSLYYPERPMGNEMNLFTLVFKLALANRIPVFEYTLDGNEQFTKSNRVNTRDLLDRYRIYYEERDIKGDTIYVVDDADIPSNEVKSYFVKEVNYFDDRASTYNKQVEAFCPVMHRTDEFTGEDTKYPMFWVRYKDVAPYLSRTYIMASDYNNVASITINDFFTTGMYKGDIYKTTNRLNRTLAQYCPTDSLMKKEQENIEKQLVSFEQNLWKASAEAPQEEEATAATEEQTKAAEDRENSKRIGRDRQSGEDENAEAEEQDTKKETKKKEEKKTTVKKSKTPKASSAPRASVRRTRR